MAKVVPFRKPRRLTPELLDDLLRIHASCVHDQEGKCGLLLSVSSLCWEINQAPASLCRSSLGESGPHRHGRRCPNVANRQRLFFRLFGKRRRKPVHGQRHMGIYRAEVTKSASLEPRSSEPSLAAQIICDLADACG